MVQDQRAAREDEERSRTNRRSALLLCAAPGAVLGIVVGVILALVIDPVVGLVVLVVLAAVVTWFLWSRAPAVVLRATGARPSVKYEHPRLYNLVEGLCGTMGLPRPTIAVVDHPLPNALAVGAIRLVRLSWSASGLDAASPSSSSKGSSPTSWCGSNVATPGPGVCRCVRLRTALAGPRLRSRACPPGDRSGKAYAADQRAVSMTRYPPGLAGALDVMAGG